VGVDCGEVGLAGDQEDDGPDCVEALEAASAALGRLKCVSRLMESASPITRRSLLAM
jgi:hypothetical protein